MSIYLISNKKDNLSKKNIQQLLIQKEDQILLFNHAFPNTSRHIKEHNNKTLILRKFHDSYHGIQNLISDKVNYKRIILVNKTNTIVDNATIIEDNYFLSLLKELFNKSYPPNKSITTGFAGFLYAKSNFPQENICLVNFTGKKWFQKEYWHGHDYDFEQTVYKELGICKI